ncbi:copper homeostasis protein [Auraticoccus monumenti]|uniref:PF03932 family protein CutC n=1 Tax=Auraticoccus monumenti TaxID=675864 RepID=A0A1G7A4E9_9ACTN|nr:copper homeostasis protein [Auraticoccus monumenti]
MHPVTLALELAVHDPRGIAVASRVGPTRIELCTALALGGLTPSTGLVDAAVAARGAGGPAVHVLIRPRSGGFDYDQHERAVLLADCRAAAAHGADGVVVGLTRTGPDGAPELDLDGVAEVVAAVPGLEVTVHRVLDTLRSPAEAVAALRGTGVRRVLTSGGAPRAVDGLATLRDVVAAAGGEIEVMAGGGVRPEFVAALSAVGVHAVHASASRDGADVLDLGLGSSPESTRHATTDEDLARHLMAAVRAAR